MEFSTAHGLLFYKRKRKKREREREGEIQIIEICDNYFTNVEHDWNYTHTYTYYMYTCSVHYARTWLHAHKYVIYSTG